jgi:N-acetylglucosamine-6-phosphate deacetylase
MFYIKPETIITPNGELKEAAVLVVDGRIEAVAPVADLPCPADAQRIDAEGLILAPGYIDLQFNGGFGHDFTHEPDSIWDVAAQLPRFGVTSFLPTIITSPLETVAHAQRVLQNRPKNHIGAHPLGLHVEGPYLNPQKKGAHNPAFIREPNSAEIRDWTAANGILLVTLAPERPGAQAMIEQLAANGVLVSAGHSMATFDEAIAGFDVGIRYGTHLFNAMPPLHHREPGLAGALLADDRVTIGLIPDGVHVHPGLIRAVWEAAGDRLNVVTDAMGAMAMPPGVYELGTFSVTVDEERATLADGTLAGSIVTMDQAVRNLVAYTGCNSAEAIRTVTIVPADLLGLTQKGRIAPGCNADLVLLTPDLHVVQTITDGKITHNQLTN